MNMRTPVLTVVSLILAAFVARGQQKRMPPEHVIETPAIGAGLCVHNLFQSNMVLQRDKPIVVWGWAEPGERVTVSFAGKEARATAAQDRTWKATLPAMPVNTKPQQVVITGKTTTITLDNILLGDVWVVGGQSNMQLPLSRVENGSVEIASANFPEIRLLTVPQMIDNKVKYGFPRLHRWNGHSHEREGYWDVCSPKTVHEFTAIGYIFARRIHMASKVPIGVIDAARWGTTVETWTPLAILKKMDAKAVRALLAEWDKKISEWDPKKDLANRIRRHQQWVESMKKQGKKIPADRKIPSDLRAGPLENANYPGNCYASIITPLAGFAVKGAIYHQGFNNSRPDAADLYYQVFPKMIGAWRAAFNDPKMPFGIISLCTDGPPQTLDNYVECLMNFGIYVREAQYKTFLDFYKAGDKNIGFASSYDLRRAWYHPQLKIPAGERIARWALATQYGLEKEIFWKPPMITKMTVEDGKIILNMNCDVGAPGNGAIEGFAIAGKDKLFQPANAELLITGKDGRGRPKQNRRVIVLSSPHVPNPIHFRYAWGRNPMGNLKPWATNMKDIPFATQRSDTWKFWEVPFLKPPEDKGVSRAFQEEVRRVFKLIDMERRLKDAQLLIDKHKEQHDREMKKLR